MRQRPKQATYSQKMESKLKVPQRVSRDVTSHSPAVISKRGHVASDNNTGKMTNFMSLDDIPDGIPSSLDMMGYEPRHSECDNSYTSLHANNIEGKAEPDVSVEISEKRRMDKFLDVQCADNFLPRHSPISIPKSLDGVDEVNEDDFEETIEYHSPSVKVKSSNNSINKQSKVNIESKRIPASSITSMKEPDEGAEAIPPRSGLQYSRKPRKVEYR